jgi:hypothetical protein
MGESIRDTSQLVKLGHGNQDSKSMMTLLPSAPSCMVSALASSYVRTAESKISNVFKKREGFH